MNCEAYHVFPFDLKFALMKQGSLAGNSRLSRACQLRWCRNSVEELYKKGWSRLKAEIDERQWPFGKSGWAPHKQKATRRIVHIEIQQHLIHLASANFQ